MRLGERTGEGALVDGDVMVGPEDKAVFKDDVETMDHLQVATSGTWADGDCRGVMLKRFDGVDQTYTIEAGNYDAAFRDILLP